MESLEVITRNLGAMEVDENVVFNQWKNAPEDEKQKYVPHLLRLLRRHAFAVCWIKLKEQRPDIVNDAIWRVMQQAGNFKGESSFSTWFQAIVQNLCTDSQREVGRQKEVGLEEVGDVAVTRNGVEAKIELEQLTKGLKARQKLLVKLKMKGLNDEEISKILGMQELAVRHSWGRVKEKIRKRSGVRVSI